MTVMTILVGVVSMRVTDVSAESKSTKIVECIRDLRPRATQYHQDTGRLPREYSGWFGPSFHTLSEDPGTAGWEGPYLDSPIRASWNPCGGQVHIFNYIVDAYTGDDGFDVDANGATDVRESQGSMITFWDVPEDVARKVDEAIDSPTAQGWLNAGSIEYQRDEQRLSVLLLAP